MSFLKILGLVVAIWLIVNTGQRLWRKDFGRAWRVCFVIFSVIGFGVGAWFLNIRYLVSPTSRVYGVPFIIAGGDFFDGRWHDGGIARFMPLALFGDLICGLALGLLPLAIISLVHQRGKKSD